MNGHPTREEDFDLYALGALEGDEKQAIESHVAECSACSRKLAEAQGRIALLALGAPRVEPSAQVKERLMSRICSTAERRDVNLPSAEAERGGTFFGGWWAAVLAPVAVALALAAFFLWKENARLDRQLAELRVTMQDQQKQLDYARNVAHLMEARDTVSVSLAPVPGMPNGDVKVMYNEKMGMLMYDGWIEPPPEDKSYQLWVVPKDGTPVSVGVFNPATSDTAHWMTNVPGGVTAKAFAVTLEPAGGMPHPTGPMVLVGPAT